MTYKSMDMTYVKAGNERYRPIPNKLTYFNLIAINSTLLEANLR